MSVATAPPQVRTQAPRTTGPKTRSFRILSGSPPYAGKLAISVDATISFYEVGQVETDPAFGPGPAFFFRKLNLNGTAAGEGYHLTCMSADPDQAAIDCECPWFARWQKCRHTDCLRA